MPLLFANEGISCTDTTVLGEREVWCARSCELERCRGAYIISQRTSLTDDPLHAKICFLIEKSEPD